MTTAMEAAVFQRMRKIGIREVPRPVPGVGQALIRVFPNRQPPIASEPVPAVAALRRVYSGHLTMPIDAFAAGLGDRIIVPRSTGAAGNLCGVS